MYLTNLSGIQSRLTQKNLNFFARSILFIPGDSLIFEIVKTVESIFDKAKLP